MDGLPQNLTIHILPALRNGADTQSYSAVARWMVEFNRPGKIGSRIRT